MRRYNLEPVKETFSWGDMLVVPLGERGRGRKYTPVPWEGTPDMPYVSVGRTRTGNPKIVRSESSDGWLMRINTNSGYKRGGFGKLFVSGDVTVIAKGLSAFGAAGRVGAAYDFIVAAYPPAVIHVFSTRPPRKFLVVRADRVDEILPDDVPAYEEVADVDIRNMSVLC